MSDRFKCAWCGSPLSEDGAVMAMSEAGLTSDIEKYWGDATLLNGDCCEYNPSRLGHAEISESIGVEDERRK